MRIKERIPILWDLFINNKELVFKYLCGDDYNTYKTFFDTIPSETVLNLWKDFPDVRFAQLLVNFGSLSQYNEYYNTEDERLFVDMGLVDARDIYFWGTIFNNNGERLPETLFETVSELSDEHLEAILEHNERNSFYLSNLYSRLLYLEIEIRATKKENSLSTAKKEAKVRILIDKQNSKDGDFNAEEAAKNRNL